MPLMRIDLYSVDQGYGFCLPLQGDSPRVFFRVEDFTRLKAGGPLPISGEEVEVPEVIEGSPSPRARTVLRVTEPLLLRGRVRSFDSNKGWGFVEVGSEVYFLHRSDLQEPFLPVIGTTISFYAGSRRQRPRACYVHRDG